MALFGSARDASLIRSINKELINRYIDVELLWFHIVLSETRENIYGESVTGKTYYQPVKLRALIDRQPLDMASDDFGLEGTRMSTFAFLRDDLKDLNVVPEIGDIFEYNNEYYEIDVVRSGDYWGGRNPSTLLGHVDNEIGEFGYNVSIICDAHVTRRNKVDLTRVRSGINNEYQKRSD